MLTRTLRSTMLAALTALVLFGSTAAVQAQNHVIDEWRSGSAHYDPFNDHLYVDRERTRVRESALDPHRDHIDFGSKKYVDRYIRDAHGRLIREFGWTWTSHGVPHGKLTRERVTRYPGNGCPTRGGVIERDRDTVIYSPGNGGVTERDRDTVIYSQPRRGGVTERNRDTVIFSQPGNNGGVTERNRDTVIFSQPSNDNNRRSESRNNNTTRDIRNQFRSALFGN